MGQLTLTAGAPCRPNSPPPGVFENRALEIGLLLSHPETYPDGQPTFDQGGIAIGDFDEDGILDIYATDALSPDRLYLSVDGRIESYIEVPIDPVVPRPQSVVSGDLNNDSHLDLIVIGIGYQILLGDGTGQFSPAASNVAEVLAPLGPFGTLSLADMDGDGWLDIAGVNGDETSETRLITEGAVDMLLAGGPDLQFTSVPLPQSNPRGVGCLPGWFDYDDDGDQDLYIVNDFGLTIFGNRLLENQGDRTFVDRSEETGAGIRVAGMGGTFGDYDNDGLVDIYTTSMLSDTTNKLLAGRNTRQESDVQRNYEDVTKVANAYALTEDHGVGWGALFLDVDADSDLDLYVVRAFEPLILDPFIAPGVLLDHPDALLLNIDGRYEPAGDAAGMNDSAVTQAPLQADLNRDGFVDIVVSTIYGRPLVWINGCDETSTWMTVRVASSDSNAYGIGAKVTITTNGVTQVREIRSGGEGAGGSGAAEAYFGLGGETAVDSLEVRWPDGTVQRFEDVPARYVVTVHRPPPGDM